MQDILEKEIQINGYFCNFINFTFKKIDDICIVLLELFVLGSVKEILVDML